MSNTSTPDKVFGRRKGKRLSSRQKNNIEFHLSKFSVFKMNDDGSFKIGKIDLTSLFENLKENELEIGFGMGDFLFQKALAQPNVGFLGCEVYENGVASLLTRIIEANLSNVLIHSGNCTDLLDNLSGAELNAVHLLFPDPWPKSKHHKRRFFTKENIDKMYCALRRGGCIFIATDIEEYAIQINLCMGERSDFEIKNFVIKDFKFPLGKNFQTKFERKAYAFNRTPRYMIFKKV